MRSFLVLCGVVCALSVVGCSKKSDDAGGGSGGAVAAGDFGVPECDSYMKKYMDCLDSKAPAAVKDTMKTALTQQKEAWKQAASTAEGKKALADACKQAEEATKQAMSAYGCSW
jgi:hypothetical protein